ncbi:MAG TPA: hypothetical protein PKY81_17165 [bacterium]|nr:hypothetical protein [bacterium]HPN32685.1 hypothetical protein [bacterium]
MEFILKLCENPKYSEYAVMLKSPAEILLNSENTVNMTADEKYGIFVESINKLRSKILS